MVRHGRAHGPTLDERPDFCKYALQKERYTPLSEVYGILHDVVVVRYTLSEYIPGYWTIPQSTLQCVVCHTISEYIVCYTIFGVYFSILDDTFFLGISHLLFCFLFIRLSNCYQDHNLGRLELVSRCMTTNTDWQGEITKVFHTLQRIGETQLTTGCSMHVHVSPSREGNGYKPEQLHSIMKAVAYFDRAVTAAVPPRPERQRMGGVKFPERKLRSSVCGAV